MSTGLMTVDAIPAISHGPFTATPVGLLVTDEDVPFELWAAYGGALQRVEAAIHFVIGDWLNYGERNYGEKYSQALGETPFSYQTLANDKWIAGRVRFSLRKENLTFNHHIAVAPLEPDEQEQWLDCAESGSLTVKELREAIRDSKRVAPADFPLGKYGVIYADPPWCYGDKLIDGYGAAEHHYPSMTIEQLCNMAVKNLAADDAVLFMWVTSPLLRDCFDVIEAWGFEYKSSFVWDKVRHNYGHYNSVRHEFLLVCTRGSCTPQSSELHDSVIEIERNDNHSEKPAYFRNLIEKLYPDLPKIELFARGHYDGWEVWGNEV